MNDEKERILSLSKDMFPSFLFNPLANDFKDYDGDNYWSVANELDESNNEYFTLKRKYRNYDDYVEALEIYERRIDELAEKYYGRKVVRNSIKAGTMEEYVPHKPKLKKTKINKLIKKYGFVPAISRAPLNMDAIGRIADRYAEDTKSDIIQGNIDVNDNPKKSIRKAIKKSVEYIERQNRAQSLYGGLKSPNSVGRDMLLEIYDSLNSSGYNKDGKQKELSVTEMIKEQERIANTPEWELTREVRKEKILYDSAGRYTKQSEEDRKDVMKDLYGMGFDIYKMYGSSMDRREIKRKVGVSAADIDHMTKKEYTKYKKKQKKEKKKLVTRQDSLSNLGRILTSNKYDFREEDDGRSLTYADLERRRRKEFEKDDD